MAATMNFFDDSPVETPKRRFTQSAWFPWLVMLATLVILLIIFSPVVFIRAGHRGLATFFGDTQGDLLAEGVHFKYPLLRIHQFDIRTQAHDVSTGVVTKDMQLVTVGVTVNYRLDTKEIRDLFDEVGGDIDSKIIDPAAKEAVNVAATQFTAEELVTDRADFKAEIVTELEARLVDSGVILENVAVIDVEFSKTLEEAYTAQNLAELEADTAALRHQTADLNADTDAMLSEAEAEQIRILGEALRGHEAYIQYEIMKKWDGKSPLYLAPTAPVQIVNGE
jgi:regulator of protease activity HflC (stomatin/prohibitin superfamily)